MKDIASGRNVVWSTSHLLTAKDSKWLIWWLFNHKVFFVKLWKYYEISDTVLKRYIFFMERITWEIIYNPIKMIIERYSNIITTMSFAQSICSHFMEVTSLPGHVYIWYIAQYKVWWKSLYVVRDLYAVQLSIWQWDSLSRRKEHDFISWETEDPFSFL